MNAKWIAGGLGWLALATVRGAAGDPFLGDWDGGWVREGAAQRGGMIAQVVPRGEGKYRIGFRPEFDQRCPPFAPPVSAPLDDGRLVFDQEGWSGEAGGDGMTGRGVVRGEAVRFELKKATRLSPRLGATPPPGAVVLFDGSSLDRWEMVAADGSTHAVAWTIENGELVVVPEFGDHKIGKSMGTRDAFRDFHLHLEFNLPLYPERTGQERANSGVIIEEFAFYEVQVLDTYGLPGYYDECGAIYNIAAPMVNMCAPPLQWQSYDIVYRGPRFDAAGALAEPARITVEHNGRPVHRDQDLPFNERAMVLRQEKPGSRVPGRIKLQDHGYPIRYRNIWLVLLDARP